MEFIPKPCFHLLERLCIRLTRFSAQYQRGEIMQNYKSILVAIDFSTLSDIVINRAVQIAKQTSAALSVLHVVDHIPPLGFGEEPLIAPDWMIPEHDLLEEAKKSLEQYKKKHNLENTQAIVSMGTAQNEIVRLAEKHSIDLIIMGSHGRHGVQLLLGSTANGVLHHAQCDVLAVRITKQ